MKLPTVGEHLQSDDPISEFIYKYRPCNRKHEDEEVKQFHRMLQNAINYSIEKTKVEEAFGRRLTHTEYIVRKDRVLI